MSTVKSNITLIVTFVAIGVVMFFVYDLLFSKPDHLQGTLVEKIFVPSRMASSATPYAGALRSNYFITAQREEQWIAIVKMDTGDTLIVHCKSDHYKSKNLGDPILFKKYEGSHFHIKYFAHNEEESVKGER
jgi:hypothetical protein